jgi:hypothetical protein
MSFGSGQKNYEDKRKKRETYGRKGKANGKMESKSTLITKQEK